VSTRDIAAIGVFAALGYAGSFVLLAVPNVTLSILLVFFAGFVLGKVNGAAVGVVSSLLITLFNPYGLPLLPILAAQVLAYAAIGFLGGAFARMLETLEEWSLTQGLLLGLIGLLTALIYQIPVSVADAWLFGPFQARLIMSAAFAVITAASNVIFFVLLFPVLANLKKLSIFQRN
jgi:hypothetical protein